MAHIGEAIPIDEFSRTEDARAEGIEDTNVDTQSPEEGIGIYTDEELWLGINSTKTFDLRNKWMAALAEKGLTVLNVEGLGFKSSRAGSSLLVWWGGRWVPLTYVKGGKTNFYSPSSLQKDAPGLVKYIKQPLSEKAAQALGNLEQTINTTENAELQELPQAAARVSQAFVVLQDTLKSEGTNTEGLSMRDLERAHEIIRTLSGQIDISQSKIVAFNQEIANTKRELARRRQKVTEAPNEEARKYQEEKANELEKKLQGYQNELEGQKSHLRNILRERMQTELDRIKESIHKFLHDDVTLGERIRTLFREQGITIVSILTALGMVISTLALAITGGGGVAAPTPSPPPSDKGGVKEWVKQRLRDLGSLLGKLADKAAAALPGIIGSVVSWLLSTAEKAVGWLAENLWALIVGVAGMVYLTAKDYMTMRLATKPKKD